MKFVSVVLPKTTQAVAAFRYYPKCKPLGHVGANIARQDEILIPRTLDKLAHWPRDELWLTVDSDHGGEKASVRFRRKRRIRAAILEALHAHGYNHRGRLLGSGEKGIAGSLSVEPYKPALNADYRVMVGAFKGAVKSIVHMQDKDKGQWTVRKMRS